MSKTATATSTSKNAARPKGAAKPKAVTKTKAATKTKAVTKTAGPPRAESKQTRLIAMLKLPDGATIVEIAAALSWQMHTVRGAIAGALKKKLGLAVTSEKIDGRGRVYRIA